MRASYKCSMRIVKAGKPFAAGNLIKDCLVDSAACICPADLTEKFEKISLSPQTVARRVEDMASDMEQQLMERAANFVSFSIALDETTDVSDVAQLVLFIRGVDDNLRVTEEFLDLIPLKDTTTGLDIFLAVENVFESMGLKWERLASVTTDGAPALRGIRTGFLSYVRSKMAEVGCSLFAAVHCLIHQEALCAKIVNIKNVMDTVVRTVNYLRSHGLTHRQFKEFLADIEAEYPDIPYHAEVRWLSRGKVLHRFFSLRDEINTFLEMKGRPEELLRDPKWVSNLAFLSDVTGHLNTLNISLQGENHSVVDLVQTIQAFRKKLILWEKQLREGNCGHFPALDSVKADVDFSDYVQIICKLQEEFENRFLEISELQPALDMFVRPFSLRAEDVSHLFQLELIDLQCDIRLKDRFLMCNNLYDFYSCFPREKYPLLHKHAAKVISMFGSTYICERFFSLLKLAKTKTVHYR